MKWHNGKAAIINLKVRDGKNPTVPIYIPTSHRGVPVVCIQVPEASIECKIIDGMSQAEAEMRIKSYLESQSSGFTNKRITVRIGTRNHLPDNLTIYVTYAGCTLGPPAE